MNNTYANLDVDLEKLLHGVARLHVHLGRMDNENISTRGWTYNDLVTGIMNFTMVNDIPSYPETFMSRKEYALQNYDRLDIQMDRAINTLFDVLDGMTEIGPSMLNHLSIQ